MHLLSLPSSICSTSFKVPGDKSISHRALMLGGIADGEVHVSGFLPGGDNHATLAVMRQLGVTVIEHDDTTLTIQGRGLNGLRASEADLDCGNAGTGMRLLAGLLAGQHFNSTLTGDQYLLRRPMGRIIGPLSLMGAHVSSRSGELAPLNIQGGHPLTGLDYTLPMASAQVKSSLLLAGLYATGEMVIHAPGICRDHTERMLQTMGCLCELGETVSMPCGQQPRATQISIPGDISSAAFFMVLAAIQPQGELTIQGVGINPTRLGVIHILQAMGAKIDIHNRRDLGAEPIADITIAASQLVGIDIDPAQVPLAIDELPVLMIAAACATGTTVLTGAQELRVKESDRISAMADGLHALGIVVKTFEDGMAVTGGALQSGEVNSAGDHRIAMAFAIAGSVAAGPVSILDADHVQTSFPGFVKTCQALGMMVESVL